MLTRAKWLYNDIKTNLVLKSLYSTDSQYKDYQLGEKYIHIPSLTILISLPLLTFDQ